MTVSPKKLARETRVSVVATTATAAAASLFCTSSFAKPLNECTAELLSYEALMEAPNFPLDHLHGHDLGEPPGWPSERS